MELTLIFCSKIPNPISLSVQMNLSPYNSMNYACPAKTETTNYELPWEKQTQTKPISNVPLPGSKWTYRKVKDAIDTTIAAHADDPSSFHYAEARIAIVEKSFFQTFWRFESCQNLFAGFAVE